MNLNKLDKEILLEALNYYKVKDEIFFDEEIDEKLNEGAESDEDKQINSLIKKIEEEIVEEPEENELLKESLNECCQIGSTVTLEKQKGYIIGKTSDGDVIVQVQGSTHKVNPKKLKEEKKNPLTLKPESQFKFDEKTQSLLFEQYVRCGIYLNNIPIKINNCYVKFGDFNNANGDQPVNVIVEGNFNLMPKSRVRIFEDVNDFANRDNYVEGVIIDEESGEAKENVLINAVDYTNALGDADMVRVIVNRNGNQEMQSFPAAILKTLTV